MDSSVAAMLTREAGHECSAVTLHLFDENNAQDTPTGDGGGSEDARVVAERLGVPFSILDLRSQFREKVIDSFVNSYLDGDTPNPCVRCNRYIKFGGLLDYAAERGNTHVATGHYARVEYDAQSGRYLIRKGVDATKDQSYMLYSLSQGQLARALFPLGGMLKSDVRRIAVSHGLPNAGRRESQDICFIQNGGYPEFIKAYTGTVQGAGPIVDDTGAVAGTHRGAVRYTIGQRKGLGVAAPAPVYVYAKSMADNTVYAGPEALLYSKAMTVRDINLLPYARLPGPVRAMVKTRYRQAEQPAYIEQISDYEIHVEFDTPQRAVTRGQSAVFYDGDAVVGGGIISG